MNKKIIKNISQIKKYKDKNIIIGIKLDEKIYYDDINNQYKYNHKYFWYPYLITAANIKDIKTRYKYIYEKMCYILDNYVNIKCDFKCDRCIANRLALSKNKINGCCYFTENGICEFLKQKKCQKKSISCKLFMCNYIEKKLKIKSIPKEYPLLKIFFNKKQQEILQHSYRKNFDEIIEQLLNVKKNVK